MTPLLSPVLRLFRILTPCLLIALPPAAVAEILPEDGPVGFGPESYPSDEPWQELDAELPPWPKSEDRLIEMDLGGPYRVYIDPRSLSSDSDRVVRFTSVLVSPSGVRNVTYEGLHCGEKSFRRFAYGMNEAWHELPGSVWQRLTSGGVSGYRSVLYYRYMCDPAEPHRDAEEILRQLRSTQPVNIDD